MQVAEKESQNQRCNVAAVNVGIRHDNLLVIAQPIEVNLLAVLLRADGYAKSLENILDLFVVTNLMLHGLFYVQDLAPERHDCLKRPVAALFGSSPCRITLN